MIWFDCDVFTEGRNFEKVEAESVNNLVHEEGTSLDAVLSEVAAKLTIESYGTAEGHSLSRLIRLIPLNSPSRSHFRHLIVFVDGERDLHVNGASDSRLGFYEASY